jgi:hypothetical protein
VPFLTTPFSLATRGADFGDGSTYITYRNVSNLSLAASLVTYSPPPFQQVIVSVTGIPGALFAGWAVELRYLGRRGSLAVFTGSTNV